VRYQAALHSDIRQEKGLPEPSGPARRLLPSSLVSAHQAARGCGYSGIEPAAILSRLRPFLLLGRSQVVRQRILIPPFPGSNPGAPTNFLKDYGELANARFFILKFPAIPF
jgi:hypothetical protein